MIDNGRAEIDIPNENLIPNTTENDAIRTTTTILTMMVTIERNQEAEKATRASFVTTVISQVISLTNAKNAK